MRHKKTEKREVAFDPIFNNRLVAKFINRIMESGKKTVAQKNIYNAFKIIEEKSKNNPVELFEKAVHNVEPRQEVKARRVGGASYQIPMEVRESRKVSLAIRWLAVAANARSSKEYHTFAEKIAAELLDASENKGEAVKKKDTMQKMADANRAFAHFRW